MFSDVTFYHGTQSASLDKSHTGMYVTPRSDYRYIQDMPHQYAMNLQPSAPYYVDNVQAIESLRSAPERLNMIKSLGFDLVAYCSPESPYIGASGWPSDASQFVILDTGIVNGLNHVEKPNQAIPTRAQHSIVKNMYHSSGGHFARFDDPDNIGFHFGTKRAAQMRQSALGTEKRCTIEHISPSRTDMWRARYADADSMQGPHQMLLHIMSKKLQSPHSNIEDIVNKMSLNEVAECAKEMSQKKDIVDYHSSVAKGQNPDFYQIDAMGDKFGQFRTKSHAKLHAKAIEDRLLKKASLRVSSPIELPDLGLWLPGDIINALPLNEVKRKEGRSVSNNRDKLAWCRSTIMDMGFDGIRYKNHVEDAGSTSYIVFSNDQIHVHQPRLPEIPEQDIDIKPTQPSRVGLHR